MSTRSRLLAATTDQVWSVFADGWLYVTFVVGAARMRAVDDTWPEVGSRLHHSVGTWPLLLDDATETLECHPGSMLRLRARAWPAGQAEVVLRLEEQSDGTLVTISEDAVSGPALLMPRVLRTAQLDRRNDETLQRLAYVVEGRR